MSALGAAIKLTGFAALVIVGCPFQILLLAVTRGPASYMLPQIWHKAACAVMRIKVQVSGAPETGRQVFYVGNHLSYLDIPAIGSVIRGSFVAKNDVEGWPVFGFLSKLQQTAFISRSRADATREKDVLDRYVSEGKSLIFFPEGTSTDGRSVLPFKSSLFSIALRDQVRDRLTVQPFTIALISADKRAPDTQAVRDMYAWHNNMDTPLHTHLWLFAKSRGAVLSVTFHPPVQAADHTDRKVLAKLCHDHVSKGLTSITVHDHAGGHNDAL